MFMWGNVFHPCYMLLSVWKCAVMPCSTLCGVVPYSEACFWTRMMAHRGLCKVRFSKAGSFQLFVIVELKDQADSISLLFLKEA